MDSKGPYTIMVQKRSKDIGKNNPCDISGSTVIVILRSYENTFFVQKKKKKTFIQQLCISLAPFWRVSTVHKQHMLVSVRCLYICDFTEVLAMFLDLGHIRTLSVYWRVRELTGCIQNILICVPNMNGGLTGLEQHEG